jgi:hypothetical protein
MKKNMKPNFSKGSKNFNNLSENEKIKVIKVAILAEEPLGWGSGKHYFPVILNGYRWKNNDVSYVFSTTYLFDKDILKGKLSVSNYDVLLVPGGGVGDGLSIMKGFNSSLRVRRWKKNIRAFIKDGGGYVGICGGTALLTGLNIGNDKSPKTFTEKQYRKSSLGVSCVNSYYKDLAIPLLYPFQRKYPEKIGATGYVFSFAPGETKDNKKIYTGGIPIDFQINKAHPIFSDFPKETERIRWWGGPALIVPEKTERDFTILAWYPKMDISKNPLTKIHAWRYIGGLSGLFFGLIKSFKLIKKKKDNLRNLLTYAYFLAGDWVSSDKTIDLNFSNKVSMTAEIYPNNNQGRILLCTSHPEYMIWWDGAIEEVDSNVFHCLATGLHRWRNIRPLSKDVIDEMTHTWWIVRRFVAWAAKVPDNHLPPIEKEKNLEKTKDLISEIFYDGDILCQMKNI